MGIHNLNCINTFKPIIYSLFDVEARQLKISTITNQAYVHISTFWSDFIFKPKTFLSFDARIVWGKYVSKYSASQNTKVLETRKD